MNKLSFVQVLTSIKKWWWGTDNISPAKPVRYAVYKERLNKVKSSQEETADLVADWKEQIDQVEEDMEMKKREVFGQITWG